MTTGTPILALCKGQRRPLRDGRISSIDKHACDGAVAITRLGLAGDTQSDRRHHGGEHMAVHHYPADHYPYWREQLPALGRLARPGAFGENIHATGLAEDEVQIGDRFRLGTALLEISMGRQPCNTLSRHFGEPDMVARIIANGRCGWYYRVIEEGTAQAGDRLEKLAEGATGWTVARAFALLFQASGNADPADLRALVALPALGPLWRKKGEAKLA